MFESCRAHCEPLWATSGRMGPRSRACPRDVPACAARARSARRVVTVISNGRMSRHKSRQRQRAERRLRELAHRTVDEVDPPAWGPPPPDATGLILLCYELRRKRLDELTVEDLRLGIGQEIALAHLMPLAIPVLNHDPLAEGDFYPGDLLASVLRVDAEFWEQNTDLAADVRSIVDGLDNPPDEVASDIERFRTRIADQQTAQEY